MGQRLANEGKTAAESGFHARRRHMGAPVALQRRQLAGGIANGGDGEPAGLEPDVLRPSRRRGTARQHQPPARPQNARAQFLKQRTHIVARGHLHAEILLRQAGRRKIGRSGIPERRWRAGRHLIGRTGHAGIAARAVALTLPMVTAFPAGGRIAGVPGVRGIRGPSLLHQKFLFSPRKESPPPATTDGGRRRTAAMLTDKVCDSPFSTVKPPYADVSSDVPFLLEL